MKHPIPEQCPVCQAQLTVRELHCDQCETTIRGRFQVSRLAALNEEQLKFVEIFLKVRGSIKEMERELNISYPTVRNRLEQVIEALGFKEEDKRKGVLVQRPVEAKLERRQEILNQLDRGEISSEEALRLLQE